MTHLNDETLRAVTAISTPVKALSSDDGPLHLTFGGHGIRSLQALVTAFVGETEIATLLDLEIESLSPEEFRLRHELPASQVSLIGRLEIDLVVCGEAGAAYDVSVSLDAPGRSALSRVAKSQEGTFGPPRNDRRFSPTLGVATPSFALDLGPLSSTRFAQQITLLEVDSVSSLAAEISLENLGLFHHHPVKIDLSTFVRDKHKPIILDGDVRDGTIASPILNLDDIEIRGTAFPDLQVDLGTMPGAVSPVRSKLGATGRGTRSRRSAKVRVLGKAAVGGSLQVDEPDAKDRQGEYFRVWYGTNREPIFVDEKVVDYSGEDAKSVRFGSCVVKVPESHKVGKLAGFFKRYVLGVEDRLEFQSMAEIGQDRFWKELARQIRNAPEEERHAVVFIHGYFVSFKDAACRASQLGSDLSINGATAFYSWPSRAKFKSYWADDAAVQNSATHIVQFLVDFAERTAAHKVHVIAHSMGNRGALDAVNEIVRQARLTSKAPFSQFILAAPDVDAEYFRQHSAAYGTVTRRTTMYVSDHDRALYASKFIREGMQRIGLAPPFQVLEGIDTVSVSDVDVSLLGHGYVADLREVITDMHQLIHLDAPPEKRATLKRVNGPSGRYWKIKK